MKCFSILSAPHLDFSCIHSQIDKSTGRAPTPAENGTVDSVYDYAALYEHISVTNNNEDPYF